MTKVLSLVLAAILAMSAFAFSAAVSEATDEIRVILNGELVEFDVPPMIVNNRTMVPMRAIFEALGMRVRWYEDYQEIWSSIESTGAILQIGFTIDDYYMRTFLNEKPLFPHTRLDVTPLIVDNRTLVPLRAIAEALRKRVNWNSETNTVYIDDAPIDHLLVGAWNLIGREWRHREFEFLPWYTGLGFTFYADGTGRMSEWCADWAYTYVIDWGVYSPFLRILVWHQGEVREVIEKFYLIEEYDWLALIYYDAQPGYFEYLMTFQRID